MTAEQDTLFTVHELAPVVPLRPNLTIAERFELFHAANPWVFDALEKLTADLVAKGQKKVGMKMLFEVVRWQYARATQSADGFKINNSLTSHYARELLRQHPEWSGVFETRRLRAA